MGLSSDEAVATLRYYKWNMDKLQNEWFENERKLRTKIGIDFNNELLKSKPEVKASLAGENGGYCMICYTQFNTDKDSESFALGLTCSHQFCKYDWEEYLKQKVNEGPQAIFASCPQHCCNLLVPHSFFLSLMKGDDMTTYKKWHCKSYTDDNKSVRWCPYPGCDYCVEY